MFFFLSPPETKSLANNGDAGDLRRHCAHYDVIVMDEIWATIILIQWNAFESLISKKVWGLFCQFKVRPL